MYFYVRILSAIGIVLSLYLLWEHFFHPAFQPCNINSIFNCNAIVSGSVSKTLGLPTSLYGLIGYIVIYFAAVYTKPKLLLAMATLGLLFCLRIAYIELFQLHIVCPVCIGCQLVMISIFVLAILLIRQKKQKRSKR